MLGDEPARSRQVVHDEHVAEQPGEGSFELRRRGDESERGHGSGRGRTWRARRRGRPADEQPGASGVVVLQQLDGAHRGVQPGHRHRVGCLAEGGCDGRLVAGANGEHGGHGAQQTGEPGPGREQRSGAVLAGQPEPERLHAGRERGPVSLGGPLLLAKRGDLGLRSGEVGGRLLVVGIEVDLPAVQTGDLALEGGEVGLGALGPAACLSE